MHTDNHKTMIFRSNISMRGYGKVGAGSHRVEIAAFNRGGNWNNGANAGVFSLNLNNAPSNSNSSIGFRCARYVLAPACACPNSIVTAVRQNYAIHTDAILLLNIPFRGKYRTRIPALYPPDTAEDSRRGQWVPY